MATHTNPVSIDGKMFKRRGAWFGLFQFGMPGAEPAFYLGTLHGMSALAPDKNRLINIFATYNGEKVAHTLEARPAELTLKTAHGDVRFTFADTTKIVAEGDAGMGLRFEKTMVQHETVHPRKNGAWEAFFRLTCSVIFKGIDGSSFDFNDGVTPWDPEKLASGDIYGQTHPAPDGGFTLVLEESTYGGIVRASYPSYAEAKASMQADWDDFVEGMPTFTEPYERTREDCEYTLWTFLTGPYGTAKHSMIQMFAGVMASQWQMCQNAVALQEHTDLAVDLLLSPIDRIGPLGQLPDMYDDTQCESLMVKPPMHGWAVLEIMKRHNLLETSSRERVEKLYDGMGRWANWFMTYRDEDEDGLPSLIHSDETGLDDCSLWAKHIMISTPDIASYIVLLLEATGDLGKLLGKPESEYTEWHKRSKELVGKLVDVLWDGERFAGLVPETRELIYSDSIIHYMPVILGDRLPREILAKLVADLSDTTTFFSPWGIASEKMTSPLFSPFGWGRGCILPPAMMYIVTGLWDTEHRAFAKSAAENYCKTLSDGNFPFFIDPKTGNGMYYGCSWSNCGYAVIARLVSEGQQT
ncbi:MAG: hypothetical protein LBN02_09620 [Oscillospiraceae bacterium]|jgi:hypothetical protein|nr:hypothetical protein [Oscillospiraceae bacterium]